MKSYDKLKKERDLYKSYMITYIENYTRELNYLSKEDQDQRIEMTIAYIETKIKKAIKKEAGE